ncbi:MAG: thioredoxin fold domain-containing protein [Planctomycetaceae bacterium]|nr:thioredoxin fold domain-containing protein [Planctomycetaceae bacterium]
MLSLQTMILAAALTATGDFELVEFTASWCGPCQAMKSTVQEIQSMGYPVRTFDFDERQDLARRFGVTQVPTYLVVANGKPIDRIVGAVPLGQLLAMVKRHATAPSFVAPVAPRPTATRPTATRPTVQRNAPQPNPLTANEVSGDQSSFEQLAMQATVRLRIEDAKGHSYGTGTIIDVHRERNSIDALILTCGHIFRDSQGKGEITVDLFANPRRASRRGVLIRYDLDRDLALVGIKLQAPIQPVPVAGSAYRIQPGQATLSIGCNHGKDPSVMRGRVKQVNKFLGPENLTVSGRPVDGRSGGGLFSTDGYLIGVCNAADPTSDEGLYAAYPSIHAKLDQSKLSFVYQARPQIDSASQGRAAVQTATHQAEVDPAGSARQAVTNSAAAVSPRSPLPRSAVPSSSASAMASLQVDGRAEVICIIRANGQPTQDRLIVLDRPSRDFMTKLQNEDREHQNRRLTELRVNRRIDARGGDRR